MKRDELVYIQHILDAIAKIEEYLQGLDEETFTSAHWCRMPSFGKSKSSEKRSSGFQANYETGIPISRGKISPECATNLCMIILE